MSWRGLLAKGSEGEGIARRKSLLPCSTVKIRQAYYVYIAALVKNDILSQSTVDNLSVTYVDADE